jgi:hypothetical protein
VNYEQAMSAIKSQVLAAVRKYDPLYQEELVFWDGEPIPQYGDLTCELSLVSSRQESFREVVSAAGDSLNVSPSSLVLATVQLKFESLNNTVNPFAMDLAERTRQDLNGQARKRSANQASLAILSAPETMVVRRKDVDGRSVLFTVLETVWRFEYFLSTSEPDTNETIRTVVAQGEGDLEDADWTASDPAA